MEQKEAVDTVKIKIVKNEYYLDPDREARLGNHPDELLLTCAYQFCLDNAESTALIVLKTKEIKKWMESSSLVLCMYVSPEVKDIDYDKFRILFRNESRIEIWHIDPTKEKDCYRLAGLPINFLGVESYISYTNYTIDYMSTRVRRKSRTDNFGIRLL